MKNCPICNIELKFLNTTVGNSGKLSNGEKICNKCFQDISKTNKDILANIRLLTPNELKTQIKQSLLTANSINEQLLRLGINSKSSIIGRKELKELPRILSIDEEIKSIVIGMYDGGTGILVATNKRLVFIDKGLLYGLKIEDFGLDKVTSVQYNGGILSSTITILASGNTAKIQNVDKLLGKVFCDNVRLLLSAPKTSSYSEPINNATDDIITQIERLAKLKESGILSNEEFESQKSKLLSKI